jgi:DNA polymerase-3 subunit alpha
LPKEFVHLHAHTHFSLGDATTLIKSDPDNGVIGLPEMVSKLGMKACAITDHGTMAGVVEFWKECKKWDIKPIFGMEAYVALRSADAINHPHSFDNPTGHIILLAKNSKGYQNLCLLLRKASLDQHFSRHPRVDLEMLYEHREGLVGLTSCMGGLPQKYMLGWRYYDRKTKTYLVQPPDLDNVPVIVTKMKDIFEPDSFFLEVQNHQVSDSVFLGMTEEQKTDYLWMKEAQHKVFTESWKVSRQTNVPMVVTNDLHYLTHDTMDSRQAVLAIGGRGFMNEKFSGTMADHVALDESEDSGGVHEITGQLYLKSPDEMAIASHFIDYPFLARNTLAVAEMIEEVDLSPLKDEKGRVKWNLPAIDLEPGETPISKLRAKALEGFDSRYPGDDKYPWRSKESRTNALKQLDYELSVMEKLGLESYHLMVADYVEFAHKNGIRVGPGRGSGAGSVVVYCLGITDLDPLRHGLLFERYLNPDRASAADLDVDFDPQRVDEIYQYCINKYGKENIARISSYASLHAKGSVRRLGRAMCLSPEWVNDISSQLDDESGETRTRLSSVIEDNRSRASGTIRKFKEAGGDLAQRFLDIAVKLDDIKISRGQHAAGIVVSGTSLDGLVPLVLHDRDDPTSIATEIPFDHLEDIGLLKQDLLVVDGLSIIDLAIKFIRKRSNPNFELLKEVDDTYDDEIALKIFSDGELAGIWQMSSSGMRELCVSLMPKDLNEIAAICALYRPGPLDYQDTDSSLNMVEMYVRRKHRLLPVTYDHPKLESILKETYGVVVFQEQIMFIARTMCDWTFTQADYLRKAVAKKKGIDKQKDLFIPDCLRATPEFGEHLTHKLWDMLETFGKYGFNKSHSAAYGKLSYQMAYIKGRYPVEFLAAAITIACDKGDKTRRIGLLHDFVSEANRKGISILAPDIEFSKAYAVPEGPSSIRLGFGACRGVASAGLKLEKIKEIIDREPEEILEHERKLSDLEKSLHSNTLAVEAAKKDDPFRLPFFKEEGKSIVKEIKELGPVPEIRYGLNSLTSAIRTVFATGVNKAVVLGLVHAGAFDRLGERNLVLAMVEEMSDLRSKKGKARMQKFFGLTDIELPKDIVPATAKERSDAAQEYLYLVLPTVDTPPPKKILCGFGQDKTEFFLGKLSILPSGETELSLLLQDSKNEVVISIGKFNHSDIFSLVRNVDGRVISIN